MELKQSPPEPQGASSPPVEILRAEFLARRERNPNYSTRAFARDIGMSQSLLSLVLNGKRPFTVKQCTRVSVLLGFSRRQTEDFIKATLLALPGNAKIAERLKQKGQNGSEAMVIHRNYEIERFTAISQWYHLAILDLASTTGFRENHAWIGRRLGISAIEAKDAIDRLLNLGLFVRRDGQLVKVERRIHFPTRRTEAAVRSFHSQMIGKALDQLRQADPDAFEARQITSMTMAIPKSSLPEAKKRIQKFQQKLAALLGDGECDEVYQLNVQLFPLTRRISR